MFITETRLDLCVPSLYQRLKGSYQYCLLTTDSIFEEKVKVPSHLKISEFIRVFCHKYCKPYKGATLHLDERLVGPE